MFRSEAFFLPVGQRTEKPKFGLPHPPLIWFIPLSCLRFVINAAQYLHGACAFTLVI